MLPWSHTVLILKYTRGGGRRREKKKEKRKKPLKVIHVDFKKEEHLPSWMESLAIVKWEAFVGKKAYLSGQVKICFHIRMNIVLPLKFSDFKCLWF